MAKVNAQPAGDGSIWQFFPDSQQLSIFPVDPSATIALDFDESTNAALVADLQANLAAYKLRLLSGTPQLQKKGAAVTIAAESALYVLQSTILNGVPDATLRTFIVALWNGTATAQQQQRAIAYLALKLLQAGIV